MSPWASALKLVVSPQPGHGRPKNMTLGHGGRPSWVWVPWPSGLGVRNNATPVTAHQNKNHINWPARSFREGTDSNRTMRGLARNNALGLQNVAMDPGNADDRTFG